MSEEWAFVEEVCKGNVFYGVQNRACAEDAGEAEDED